MWASMITILSGMVFFYTVFVCYQLLESCKKLVRYGVAHSLCIDLDLMFYEIHLEAYYLLFRFLPGSTGCLL